SFTYLIDSGGDVSILKKTIVGKLKLPIEPNTRALSGLVVSDSVMPANIDAIIGWDVMGLRHIRVTKGVYGLELYHDLSQPSQVLTMKNPSDLNKIQVSGLDEQSTIKLRQLLVD
ncbi:hypothetical protein BDFB_013160, partial [Asbolus verrucosus]